MKGHKLLSILLILSLLLAVTACGGEVYDAMGSGADRFAQGKQEENYAMKNSGALLDDLIEKYSGGYEPPDATPMSDEDYEDEKSKADEEQPPEEEPDEAPDEEPDEAPEEDSGEDTEAPVATMAQVGSWDELLRVFYDAYAATASYVEFELVNGFTFDPYVDLQESYTELQRQDPIYVGSVEQWGISTVGSQQRVYITYTMDVEELIRVKEATEALVEEAVSHIDTEGKSDYELVCAVNEYLCDTVYYPPTEPYAPMTHTAYGAFADGVAVCEGYACAAKLMLNELGILCDIQVGECIGGGGHAWNLVQLDGQWYQMDVTWNDGGLDRTDYLLVTDDYMRKSRMWDESNYPACAETAYTP